MALLVSKLQVHEKEMGSRSQSVFGGGGDVTRAEPVFFLAEEASSEIGEVAAVVVIYVLNAGINRTGLKLLHITSGCQNL